MLVRAACMASGRAVLPAHAADTTLYVDEANSACTDTGSGTSAAPFCTIQAGVDAAVAGDTVRVSRSSLTVSYRESVTISRSGTADAPITIAADPATQTVDTGYPFIFQTTAGSPSFTFNGASNIKLYGFGVLNYTDTPVIAVQNSSNIAIDTVGYKEGSGGVTIDGTSTGVTISRSVLGGISIASGASGVTLTGNNLEATAPVAATSVNGLAITGNTILRGCPSGIDVEGTSQNVSIENNIVSDDWGWGPGYSGAGNCAPGGTNPKVGDSPEVTVSAGSAAGTAADYNDIFSWQSNQAAAYSWNGTVHQTVAAFTAATGQGVHDIAARGPRRESRTPTSPRPSR